MTVWHRKTVGSLSLALAGAIAACTSYTEIPIETPIQPKLDVSAFQRVLVAGFIAGGSEDVDANLETVRLLRSQLRTKSELRTAANWTSAARRGRPRPSLLAASRAIPLTTLPTAAWTRL